MVGDGDVDEAAVTAVIPGFPGGDAPQVPSPVQDESVEDIFGEVVVDPAARRSQRAVAMPRTRRPLRA